METKKKVTIALVWRDPRRWEEAAAHGWDGEKSVEGKQFRGARAAS